jgi:UDP-GlcNAc:undecaprenyl-phosphate GlcNAc-1-phosphate transferase
MFVLALVAALAITPGVYRLALATGLYDKPDIAQVGVEGRKIHKHPVPRVGGVAIVFSFLLAVLFHDFDADVKAAILASILVFAVGLIDDVLGLKAWQKLSAQIISASIAVLAGKISISSVSFGLGGVSELPIWLGFVFSVLVIVGACNAINMIDGLDGLAGGVVLIGISLVSVLSFIVQKNIGPVIYLAIPLAGAVLGFLRYNTHPATIFMGDCGSNWLGFMVGVFIVLALSGGAQLSGMPLSQITVAPVPLMSVILCFSVPVFDTACVMTSRMGEGINPMKADKRHFHHTLLKLGLSHAQSVSAMYFIAIAMGFIGILPVVFERHKMTFLPYVAAVGLIFMIMVGISLSAVGAERAFQLRAQVRENKNYHPLFRKILGTWDRANRYVLYSILLASPAFAGVIRADIGYAALAAASAILLIGFFSVRKDDFLDSLLLSLGALILLIANNTNLMTIEINGHRHVIQNLYNGLFAILIVSTLLLFILTVKRRYFIFNPSDFLLVTLPLIMLLIPEPFKTEYRLDAISLKSIVVFVAIRNMIKRRKQTMFHLRAVTVAALIFVALTGVWGLRIVY